MAREMLRVTAGPAAGGEIELGDELLIGREVTGEGLDGDSELSRRHARISRESGGGLQIEDLGSSNGTFVNGRRVNNGPQHLSIGDEVSVGMTKLTLEDPAGAAPPPPPADPGRDLVELEPTKARRIRLPEPMELEIVSGPEMGRRLPIGGTATIGRDPG